MKIIEPSAVLIRPQTPENGIVALRFIESMARISHRSEDGQTADSWRRFLEAVVVKRGDWSVAEHASATVSFRVDRGFMAELTRHRMTSFTIESTRFVNYTKRDMDFIAPTWKDVNEETISAWKKCCQLSEETYMKMVTAGVAPQIARSVLPNALATTIAATANLRNWRHIFLMRTSKEAHPDMRRVMVPLLTQFQNYIPVLFDDIIPEARQIDNLQKGR